MSYVEIAPMTATSKVHQLESAYVRHADALVKFATGLVGSADASDVVTDTLLRCCRSPQWGTVANERAYLMRAVLNQARSNERSAARRRARERRAAALNERLVGANGNHGELFDALTHLSVKQRAVIVLTYWEDATARSVAATLGISEGSVRKHLSRANDRLRELLADHRPTTSSADTPEPTTTEESND